MTHAALHASAPGGMKCADCTMDSEPCPTFYETWWRERHHHTILLAPSQPLVSEEAVLGVTVADVIELQEWNDKREDVTMSGRINGVCALALLRLAETDTATLDAYVLENQQLHDRMEAAERRAGELERERDDFLIAWHVSDGAVTHWMPLPHPPAKDDHPEGERGETKGEGC